MALRLKMRKTINICICGIKYFYKKKKKNDNNKSTI